MTTGTWSIETVYNPGKACTVTSFGVGGDLSRHIGFYYKSYNISTTWYDEVWHGYKSDGGAWSNDKVVASYHVGEGTYDWTDNYGVISADGAGTYHKLYYRQCANRFFRDLYLDSTLLSQSDGLYPDSTYPSNYYILGLQSRNAAAYHYSILWRIPGVSWDLRLYDEGSEIFSTDSIDQVDYMWCCSGPGGHSYIYYQLTDLGAQENLTTSFGALPWGELHDCTSVIDADGAIHVAGKDSSGYVVYSKKPSGGAWDTKTIDNSVALSFYDDNKAYVYVGLRPSGKAILGWYDDYNGVLKVADPTIASDTPSSSTVSYGIFGGRAFPYVVSETVMGFGCGDNSTVAYIEFSTGGPMVWTAMY